MVLGAMRYSNAGVVDYTPKSVSILHDCGWYDNGTKTFLLLRTFSFLKVEWYHILDR